MSTRRFNVVAVGAAACAACCAGPIIGFLAAIGLGTAVGFALFGTAALVVGALALVVVLQRRRPRSGAGTAPTAPIAVDEPTFPTRR